MATTTQEEMIGVEQTPASVLDVKLEVEVRSESMTVREAGEDTDEPTSIKQELLCVVCGASFSTDASLVEHQQTHPNSQDKSSGLPSSHNTLPHTSSEGGPFQCNTCGKTFSHPSKLWNHKLIHLDVDIFKCTICSKAFRTTEDMQQHKQMHNKKKPFSCDLCSEAFKTRSSLLKHERANHSGEGSNAASTDSNQKKRYVCTYCYKTFRHRSYLVKHERIHTNEKPFDCIKCGKAFNWKGNLRKHMATHHADNRKAYSCTKCGTFFQTYYLLSRHRQLHKDRPHTCSICKKMFAKKRYFQKHLLRHKKEEFICGTCNKRFSTHLKLKKHTESHKAVQNHHSCNTCSKSFKTASRLQKHRQSAHKTNQQHACRFCQGRFRSVTRLNIHLRKHAKAKTRGRPSRSSKAHPSTGVSEQYSCGICSNSFETYYRMRKHKQMHQERPFMCDMCEETYIKRADLHQHKQNDCVDSYVCEVCNKTFTSESALQSHKIKHVLEKPYLCGVCLKSFKTTSQLKVHMLSHTGKKPYVCQACNKEFTKVIHLQRHQLVCKKKTKCKGSNTISQSTTDILVMGTAAVTGSPLGNYRPDSDQSTPQTGIQTAKKKHYKQKKDYICSFCGKNSKNASHHEEHERVHSNERPFSCDDCGRAFKRRHTLKLHRQTHKKADLQKALIKKGPYPYSSSRTEHHRGQLENPVNREDVMSPNSVEAGSNPLSASHLVEGFTMFTNLHPPNQSISYTSSGQFVHSDVTTSGNQLHFQNEEQECITIQGFMCEICNSVLDTNGELEMHRRSHDEVELSTSTICREALDTINHSTIPGATDVELASTDRRVQAIPYDPGTELSDSDGDAGLPDPSDDMDGELVEITCTGDLNSDENFSSLITEPEVDCRDGGSQSTTKKDSLGCVQQLFTNSRKLEVVLNKIQFFTCGICNRDFQTSTELDKHKMSHQEETSDCTHATENPVTTLQQVYAARKSLSCRFCGKICSHRARLLEHERMHTNEKPHKPDECGQEFPRGSSLQDHNRVHKTVFPSRIQNGWKCETCEKVFLSRHKLDRHASTHSDKRPYRCICGRCYKHKYHMKAHQVTCREKTGRESLEKTNESDTSAPGPAEDLPVSEGLGQNLPKKDFKSSFACHLSTHSGVSPHKCDSCSRAYQEKSQLEVHKTTCGEKSSGESLEETSGDVQQSDTTAFGSIEEIQVGEGQLFLTKVSSQGSTPKTPPLVHDKKSMVCNICEKVFQTKTSFIIHLDDHRDEHPHKCDICGSAYKRSSQLKAHKDSCKTSGESPETGNLKYTGEKSQHNATISTEAEDISVGKVQQVPPTKNGFPCRFCGKVCSHRARLVEHERSHTKEKPFKCDMCDQAYSHNSSLRGHLIICHKREFPMLLQCNICKKHFRNENRLQYHLETHRSKKLVPVASPDRIRHANNQQETCHADETDGPADGEVHNERTHTKGKPFKCDECDKAFAQKNSLRRHLITYHKRDFPKVQCRFCSKVCSHQSNLLQHERVHTHTQQVPKFPCRYCSKVFSHLTRLLEHERVHTKEKPFKCDECDQTFSQTSSLRRHLIAGHKRDLETHSSEKLVPGASDETRSANNQQLIHQADETAGPADGKVQQVPRFPCRFCGKACTHLARLLEHERVHTKEKPCKCDECNQAFPNKSSLRTHLISCHDRVFPKFLPCNICRKYFKNEGKLKCHMDTHRDQDGGTSNGEQQTHQVDTPSEQGVKRFSHFHRCTLCRENFKSLSVLEKHMQLPHFEERPFRCDKCDKMFQTASRLKQHTLQVHTNIREFRCRFCSKGFCNRSDCIRHERTHSTDRTRQNLPTADGADMRVPRSRDDETSLVNTCKLCQEDFPSAADLFRHTTEVHQVERLRNMICEMCDKEFTSVCNLKEHHIQVHTNIRLYKCQLCNKGFCRRTNFIRHEETHKKTMCSLCGKKHRTAVQPASKSSWGTLNMRSKSGYMRTLKHPKVKKKANNQVNPKESCHTGSKRFQCAICGGSFLKMSCFKVHQEIHKTGVEPIYCIICGKHFKIPKSLHTHQLMFHSGKLSGDKKPVPNKDTMKCEKCGDEFPESSSLISHLTSVHSKPRPYSCEDCAASFPTSWRLKAHKQQMHPTGRIKLFVCTVCNKGFHLLYLLNSHSRKHSESQSRELNCIICSESFKTEQCLLTHMRFHSAHTKSMCHICGKLFARFAQLKAHLLIHSDKRDFICERCGKGFKTRPYLRVHRKSKCNVKQVFTCETCGKSFPRKSFLTMHARSHRDRRRACPYCKKVFKKQGDLTIHMRMHTNTRPYSCKFCRKTFRTRGVQRSHQNTHTGERPFKCKICDAAFACSGSLYNHKRFHKKKHTSVKRKAKC